MNKRAEKLSNKVDYFKATEDGEASKKSQGASNKSQLSFHGHLDITINLVIGQCVFFFVFLSRLSFNGYLDIPINFVVGRCVKMDLEEVQLSLFPD